MASANPKTLWKDESGAALLEFTAAAFTFFLVVFGVVEFSYAFFQWNAATKAVQLGARLAAVSGPVADGLLTRTLMEGGALPGQVIDPKVSSAANFDFICDGVRSTCYGSGGTRNLDNLKTIVFGRCGGDTGDSCTVGGVRDQCNYTSSPRNIGMCNIFTKLTSTDNVEIRYQYTGLGYAGRPGGAVPTITVSIVNLNFDFVLLGAFLGNSIPMPGFATTVTGEDLNVAWSG